MFITDMRLIPVPTLGANILVIMKMLSQKVARKQYKTVSHCFVYLHQCCTHLFGVCIFFPLL